MYLTVPIPVSAKRNIIVTIFRADCTIPPKKYKFKIDKSASVFDLKVVIGKQLNVAPTCLITLDVYNNKFHREFVDKESTDEIQDSDQVYAYEIIGPHIKQQEPKEKKQENNTDNDTSSKDNGMNIDKPENEQPKP